jgi:hypothetical protein
MRIVRHAADDRGVAARAGGIAAGGRCERGAHRHAWQRSGEVSEIEVAGLLLVLVGVAVWLLGGFGSGAGEKRRLRALAARRHPLTPADFLAALPADLGDERVATETFRRVQRSLIADFPLQPADDLENTLGIGAAALVDIMEDVVSATGRSFTDPPAGTFRDMRTVADLMRFVAAQPRAYGIEPAAAPAATSRRQPARRRASVGVTLDTQAASVP